MNNKLPDEWYLCQVLPGSEDPMHRGAVKVKVLGVTENFTDEQQPYVYPALMNGIQQVPQSGYYLRVRFQNGNINFGKYYGMSATPLEFPSAYTQNYPDVAVGNLGEDGFWYTHNRKEHLSTISNPGNNCLATWDANGFITMECGNAHPQSGMGAKEGKGANMQYVLTENLIDIFTCMPVGNNREKTGIGQGSEYLAISHISKATIDAFHGSVAGSDSPGGDSDDINSMDPENTNDVETRDIVNAKKEKIDSVEFRQTEKRIPRGANKKIKRIVVCSSLGECFPVKAKSMMNSQGAVHYLVGRADGVPEVLADNDGNKSSLKNTGFIQFIELKDDASLFSGNKINKEKVNVDAVVIMLIGNVGMLDPDFTDYQYETTKKLVAHIRAEANDTSIPVIVPNNFDDSTSSMRFGLLQKSKFTDM